MVRYSTACLVGWRLCTLLLFWQIAGIRDTVHVLMDNGIVTKEDLHKLDKKLEKNDVD